MSEYMPTTEDVKNCYVYAGEGLDGNTVKPVRTARSEFDRWLSDHDRKVAAEALRTEAFSGLYGTFAQERLLTRADRIEQGGKS